jgi:hypothetical protein
MRPVNAKVNNYQRGGSMMVHANGGGAPNYFPNSFLGPTPSADGIWHSDSVSGDILITFPTVFLARRLVPMASGIVILCRATFCIVRLETRTIFCNVENSFAVRLTPMLTNTELTTLLDKLLALRNSFENELLQTLLAPTRTMDD